MPLKWWLCPALTTCGAEMVQGGAVGAPLDVVMALADVEVVRASRVPAARIRAAPRPNRLCATVIFPPSWGGHPRCPPELSARYGAGRLASVEHAKVRRILILVCLVCVVVISAGRLDGPWDPAWASAGGADGA